MVSCALADFSTLCNLLEGWITILPKHIPSFDVLMMVVESDVQSSGPKPPIGVYLG